MPTATLFGRSRKIGSVEMMDRNLVRASALFILLFLMALAATDVQANTCIEGKPVKISGILCGRVFDPTGAPVSDVELRLLDEAGSVAAEIRADSKGNFAFSALPTARYRLTTTTPGWTISFGAIEISGRKGTICKQPVTVILGLISCQGGVSRRKPPHG
jgi:Carboxypeptidase regulatory-like domain